MLSQEELEGVIEALLFLNPKGFTIEEIGKMLNVNLTIVKNALENIKRKYENFSNAIEIANDFGIWKFRVKARYVDAIKDKVKVKSEFSPGLLKTLAIIAYKGSIKQSDLVKIRGNKAYDHVKRLIELGFVKWKDLGKTKLLMVTSKFYQYFDIVSENEIREKI